MLFPAATVLALFGIWSGYWYFAQAQARVALITQREKLAANGFTLSCREERFGGYPFRFEFTCAKPLLRFGNGTEFSASTLLMLAQAYDPKHVVGLAEGPTQVRLHNGKQFDVRHDRAVTSVILDSGEWPRISAVVNNVSVKDVIAARHLEFHGKPATLGTGDIAVDGEVINIQDTSRRPFSASRFQLRAKLAWPAKLSIETMALRAGTVEVAGSGTLGLDAVRRPTGQINLTVNDPQGLLKLTEPYFDASDKERTTVRTLFSFLGKSTSIAISARNGELFVGPFKAADLEPLY